MERFILEAQTMANRRGGMAHPHPTPRAPALPKGAASLPCLMPCLKTPQHDPTADPTRCLTVAVAQSRRLIHVT